MWKVRERRRNFNQVAGGARFKVDSHSVYQLFLQDTGKKKKKERKKTKPSGFVKRRRVSFDCL